MSSKHPSLIPWVLQALLLVSLVGLTPLIYLWNQNLGQIQSKVVLLPFLVTLGFIIVTTAIWLLISRSLEKSALLASLTFLFFFSFGHLYNLIEGRTLFGFSIGYAKFLAIILVIFAGLAILALRAKVLQKSLFFTLNILVAGLFLVNLVPILIYTVKTARPAAAPAVHPSQAQNTQTGRPDIYYIVLDAYSRQDVLKSLLNYDDSAFYDGLRQRGFYIPECAFSNYDGTDLTVGSVLNMDLLQDLSTSGRKVGQDNAEDPNRIINNKVRTYFKQYGYLFVTGRGFTPSNDVTNSDIYLNYALDQAGKDELSQNKFSALYLNTTMLRVLTELYKQNPVRFSKLPLWWAFEQEADPGLAEATYWYTQNNYMFDSLEKLPKKPGAYLVYAHINAPHGPYVFQSDGSFQYPLGNPLDPEVEKRLYAHELTYLNQRVLKMVDTILKDSDIPPIIIIQADHGMHGFTSGLEKHKILSAFYLPGSLSSPPYATITPVNDFRLIIKNYFDPSIELSPDLLYVKFTNKYESVPASCDLQP